jgi:phosphoribosylanthranilate isomerase
LTIVKICGIQTVEAALMAAEAGADLFGLVFVPGRRRRIEPALAKEMVLAMPQHDTPTPKAVGLFADQPVEYVNETARQCGLHMAQLCGDEGLDYISKISVPVIKVLHVKGNSPEGFKSLAQKIGELRARGHWIILDKYVKGLQGGSGLAFDWDVARQLSQQGHQFILAGGLTPNNVAQAIRIARPWGVDVSSGVETDGKKDHAKIREFITQVKQVHKRDA